MKLFSSAKIEVGDRVEVKEGLSKGRRGKVIKDNGKWSVSVLLDGEKVHWPFERKNLKKIS